MIRFESVTKRYGDTVAVDELDLAAPSGQITVLVGPSGCGKTTSLRMINRMIAPTSGRIFIDDRDTAKGSTAQLRRGIGYVIQHAGLFPHRTVLDNVATVPVLLGVNRKKARTDALGLLERVGPAGRIRRPLPGPALGRAAAARRRRPGAGGRPAGHADGRAVQRGRPGRAGPAAGGVPAPAGRAGQDHRLRHARHRRGDQDGRPGRGPAGRRQRSPSSPRRPSCSRGQPTRSSPASSAATGATAPSASPPPAPCRCGPRTRSGSVPSCPGRPASPRTAGCSSSTTTAGRRAGWRSAMPCTRSRGQVTPELLNLGGTLASETGTLREALDAALSSPSGRGVVVTPDGQFAGTITAAQVLTRIEAQAMSTRLQAQHDASVRAGATSRTRRAGRARRPRRPLPRPRRLSTAAEATSPTRRRGAVAPRRATPSGGLGLLPPEPARGAQLAVVAHLALGAAGRPRPGHLAAAGLAGQPLPVDLPADRQRLRHPLHDPVAGDVRRAAGAAAHPHPRHRERRRRAHHLRGRAARARHRRCAGLGPVRSAPGRQRHGLSRPAAIRPGRPAARGAGHRGRPAGRGGRRT